MASATTYGSPLQSARGAKRPAMSSSTLSSDVQPDIISLIRHSPTEIGAFAVGGRPTSSSTQFGSISHLSVRNSAPSRPQHAPTELDDPLATVIAMYNLEEATGSSTDLDAATGSNQVVLRQNDNLFSSAAICDTDA